MSFEFSPAVRKEFAKFGVWFFVFTQLLVMIALAWFKHSTFFLIFWLGWIIFTVGLWVNPWKDKYV